MNEPSIFTRIINGEIPCHKIYEDDRVISILDLHPQFPGHTLVIPKKQVDHIWDLDQDDYDYLWQVARKIGLHIREVIKPTRLGITVEGFGVPHTHIHLIPIYHSNDLKSYQDHSISPTHEELAEMAAKLRL